MTTDFDEWSLRSNPLILVFIGISPFHYVGVLKRRRRLSKVLLALAKLSSNNSGKAVVQYVFFQHCLISYIIKIRVFQVLTQEH